MQWWSVLSVIVQCLLPLCAGNGIQHMFPIQYKTYDYIYDGKDVIGQARECCRVTALWVSAVECSGACPGVGG